MSLYVDDLRSTRRTQKWPYNFACHLMADTYDELHEFASRIGLRQEWFHVDHYDLTAGKRWDALAKGAVPVSTRQMVKLRQAKRAEVAGMQGERPLESTGIGPAGY